MSSKINPLITSSLNPNIVSSIPGLYLFSKELEAIGFTVPHSDNFWLLFDSKALFQGVAIKAQEGFFNTHNLNNDWAGFMIHARDQSYICYNLKLEWTGISA